MNTGRQEFNYFEDISTFYKNYLCNIFYQTMFYLNYSLWAVLVLANISMGSVGESRIIFQVFIFCNIIKINISLLYCVFILNGKNILSVFMHQCYRL